MPWNIRHGCGPGSVSPVSISCQLVQYRQRSLAVIMADTLETMRADQLIQLLMRIGFDTAFALQVMGTATSTRRHVLPATHFHQQVAMMMKVSHSILQINLLFQTIGN